MIWLILLVPFLIGFFVHVKNHDSFTLKEYILMIGLNLFLITMCYFIDKYDNVQDKLYQSEIITRARYYESWETWVKKRCSYTTCTGSGKNRHCTTHYYDCSYCDYNHEYYTAVTVSGREYGITREKYYELMHRWKSKQQFNELDRNINYHGSCGKDGDMYEVVWNNDIYTSETATIEKSYENKTQVALSAFNYKKITPDEAFKLKLYEYPEITNVYNQEFILGLNTLSYTTQQLDSIQKLYSFLNGYYGKNNKVHVFILLWNGFDQSIALKQEAYWARGNENEIIINIGVSPGKKLDWVYAFSWCKNKMIEVDLREDIMELKKLNFQKMYPIITREITQHYKYRNLKEDFAYLDIELTTKQLVIAFILSIILTIILIVQFLKHEIFS